MQDLELGYNFVYLSIASSKIWEIYKRTGNGGNSRVISRIKKQLRAKEIKEEHVVGPCITSTLDSQ
jgi:hypothetical protein